MAHLFGIRPPYRPAAVPDQYNAGWFRIQLVNIARSIWQPVGRTVTSHYTVTATDDCLFVDCTAGAITITFPPASQMQGVRITVKKVDVSGNAITLSGTIDGAANPTISASMARYTIQSHDHIQLNGVILQTGRSETLFSHSGSGILE